MPLSRSFSSPARYRGLPPADTGMSPQLSTADDSVLASNQLHWSLRRFDLPRLRRQACPPAQNPDRTPHASTSSTQIAPESPRSSPVSPSSSSKSIAQPRKHMQHSARPICTHTNMVRIHSDTAICDLCGHSPRIGFVYACEQDHTLPALSYNAHLKPPTEAQEPASTERGRYPPLRRLLQLALPSSDKSAKLSGLNAWVAAAASKGEYTPGQVETLIAQKAHVRQMIMVDQAQRPVPSQAAVIKRLETLGLQHLAKDTSMLSDSPICASAPKLASSSRRKSSVSRRNGAMCEFQVCHSCRPVSRDRVWMSFDAIVQSDLELLSQWHPHTMPVADRATVSSIGMSLSKAAPAVGYTSSESPHQVLSDTGTTLDFPHVERSSSSQHIVKSQPSNQEFRASMHRGLVDLLSARRSQSIQASPGSLKDVDQDTIADAIKQISAGASMASLETQGFDVHLWRALAHEDQVVAASTRLPGEDNLVERFDLHDDRELVRLACVAQTGHGCTGKESAQPALGVKVTEEAADSGSPDVVISSV